MVSKLHSIIIFQPTTLINGYYSWRYSAKIFLYLSARVLSWPTTRHLSKAIDLFCRCSHLSDDCQSSEAGFYDENSAWAISPSNSIGGRDYLRDGAYDVATDVGVFSVRWQTWDRYSLRQAGFESKLSCSKACHCLMDLRWRPHDGFGSTFRSSLLVSYWYCFLPLEAASDGIDVSRDWQSRRYSAAYPERLPSY